MKKIGAFAVAFALMFSGVSCSEKKNNDGNNGKKEVFPDFTVEFLDVGKADSMVIHTENSTVLIDCGEKNDGKDIVAHLEEKGIESIDYLIITHYDKDHVGGASKVIKNIEVKNILAPDYEETNSETEKYMKAVKNAGITPVRLTDDVSFTLDGVDYIVYAPEKDWYGDDDDNDFSLVTKAVYHDTSFLFTGDAMYQRLEEIMDIGQCTLLKIPYHARKIENLEQFVGNVKPKYAVACTSAEEFADSTREILQRYNITSYATCYNGDITAVSDGSQIKITTEK